MSYDNVIHKSLTPFLWTKIDEMSAQLEIEGYFDDQLDLWIYDNNPLVLSSSRFSRTQTFTKSHGETTDDD